MLDETMFTIVNYTQHKDKPLGGGILKNRIKEVREEKNMTQTELEEKAGVTRTVISQLENGSRTVVTSETMLKLSKALGRSLDELFLQ